MKIIHIAPLLLSLHLVGCGGGGGDPGTCSGSPEWCAQTGGSGSGQIVSPIPITTFVRVPDALLTTTTCPDILALNNGDKIAAAASAQDAYQRGNTGLDGDKDGLACNGVF